MEASQPRIPAHRILVMMPNWLGDAVMATPFLRALRHLYPTAHIAALARPLVAPVLAGLPHVDETHIARKSDERAALPWIRRQQFDLAILLPNSFRSAWLVWRAGIKQRLGYARDWRTPLLTDRLRPILRSAQQRLRDKKKSQAIRCLSRELGQSTTANVGSQYEPIPTIDYYLKLAEYLGAAAPSKTMQLAITPEEKAEAEQALALAGIAPEDPLVTIVPGANFGSSKCWPAERFAQVADRLMDRPERGGDWGAHVLLATSPAELPLANAILAASLLCPNGGGIGRLHALAKMNDGKGLSLGALKQIVKRSRLMLCNDTGPRHFAAAFNIPTVTLFGPTDPVWAETFSQNERILRIEVPCGPCQLKQCPIDHRCMKGLTVEMVMNAIHELWNPMPAEPYLTTPRLNDLAI